MTETKKITVTEIMFDGVTYKEGDVKLLREALVALEEAGEFLRGGLPDSPKARTGKVVWAAITKLEERLE